MNRNPTTRFVIADKDGVIRSRVSYPTFATAESCLEDGQSVKRAKVIGRPDGFMVRLEAG